MGARSSSSSSGAGRVPRLLAAGPRDGAGEGLMGMLGPDGRGGPRPTRKGRPAGRAKLRYHRVIEPRSSLSRSASCAPAACCPRRRSSPHSAGVSLITVRRALDELEREGRVTGHQGVGTFVARPRMVTEPRAAAACWPRSPSRAARAPRRHKCLRCVPRRRGAPWRPRWAWNTAAWCGRSCACASSTASRWCWSRRSCPRLWRQTWAAADASWKARSTTCWRTTMA